MFKINVNRLFEKIGESKKMVLATSLHNHVSARMMSFVIDDHKFYCQTDKTLKKYQQLKENPLVALCFENIQIEGIALNVGKPTEHKIFREKFEKFHKNSYDSYSHLENEIIFEISPTIITIWKYESNIPYREIYNFDLKTYTKETYSPV